ncbi:UDP-N-acetylmuramyl pentapeptide phosphotransferase, partial [bacterium]|nr:UDP-N-acetylmuramyl pentapeptide phosphotransferase [bacterium]NIN91902.1 UDP-N-acetylmuramyl pentapeptide phosphotransferase [bacterium]NIO18828.1 UDP-N-acetylmuramyl pentapeptide phosphotransferase [bacterium]NIO73933.1 UDP-N-acetylmuramyl pentapeptide phosphotransferase [bacterium]
PLSTAVFLLPLAVFVVGTANFYNFMDGINGIAAITGMVGF